jgi:hypothetical protein
VRSFETLLRSAAEEAAGQENPADGRVEDLCLTFERRMSTSQQVLGEERSLPLVEGGADLDVTAENAHSFVQRYLCAPPRTHPPPPLPHDVGGCLADAPLCAV